jgi:hypothetical protein
MAVSTRVNASVRTGGPYSPGTAADPTEVTIPVTFQRPALPIGCLFTAVYFYMECVQGPFTGPLGNSFSIQSLNMRTGPPFYGGGFFTQTQQLNTPAPGYTTEKHGMTVFDFSQAEIPFRNYVTSDPASPKTLELNWNHFGQFIGFELTDLYMVLWTDDPCAPTGGGGDDDDDDDDDDDPNHGSGIYRAIKADSPRAYLHHNLDAAIQTHHIPSEEVAFASGAHSVKWWKQFDYDRREGKLWGLGRVSEGGSSVVHVSEDSGMSMAEVFEVECNSAVIQMDSEKRLLVLLTEAEPADPEDPESNGVVTLYTCEDGTTFDNEGSPQYNGGNLSARLLGMTYDQRSGGALFLLCQIGANKRILKSEDSGKSWALFGSL